jgi:predicted nucleic acid-binding protein
MLTSDAICLCVDSRILIEYEQVLLRPKFRIDPRKANIVIEYIRSSSEVHPTLPLHTALPDADDSPFLEVALSSGAACLVTGNTRHFPAHCREGLRVLSPADFLHFFRRTRG